MAADHTEMTTHSTTEAAGTASRHGSIGKRNLEIVPLKHPGRWVAMLLIALVFVGIIQSATVNPNYQWDVVRQYLFSAPILTGLFHTIGLTIVAMVIGILLGIVFAIMRLSPNPVISKAAAIYTWMFRGIPVMVQLLFWYFLSALFPYLSFGIPFGPTFVSVPTNSVINQLGAAILGLGLSEAAYMAEIVRSGIMSVPGGQTEAAKAIGMSGLKTMRRIVLPQALRIIIPPTGNETIGMLKNTTMVIVIAYTDLLTSASLIYARNYKTIPLIIVACFWYLVMTTVLMIIQAGIERRYGRGFNPRSAAPGWFNQLRARFKRDHKVSG